MITTGNTVKDGLSIAESIKNEFCDNFCKWPFNTETQEDLNEICERCPFNNPLGYCPHQE